MQKEEQRYLGVHEKRFQQGVEAEEGARDTPDGSQPIT